MLLAPGLALRRSTRHGRDREGVRLKRFRADPDLLLRIPPEAGAPRDRDGRGRRQPGGAPQRAGDRETESPETPPCEGRLSTASCPASRRLRTRPSWTEHAAYSPSME